jgi:hypothetical protein
MTDQEKMSAMKRVVFLILLIASIAFVRAEAARIVNLENLAIPERTDGTGFSLEEVRALIMNGCTRRDWKPDYEGSSVITCSILVRGRHFVKVEIPFSEVDYSIYYLDSDQMEYNPEKQSIHRKYNGWVNNLRLMIDQQFSEAVAKPPGTIVEEHSSGAADEGRYEALLKLGELRDKGLISEEEFEAEKAKLLGQE